MDYFDKIFYRLGDWISRSSRIPLIYVGKSDIIAHMGSKPWIGFAFMEKGNMDPWKYGSHSFSFPDSHIRIGWAHYGLTSGRPKKGSSHWVVVFDISKVREFDSFVKTKFPDPRKVRDVNKVKDAFQKLTLVFSAYPKAHSFMLKAAILELLAVFDEQLFSPKKGRLFYSENIEKVLDFIHKNISNPDLSLEMVSKNSNINKSHLCRIFKESINMTVVNYIRKIRMEHAADLLRRTNMLVYEVSDKVGITDPFYFSRMFSKYHGFPPKDLD